MFGKWPRPAHLQLSLAVFVLAAVSVPSLLAQAWYNPAWTSRQQITINSATGTYGISTDLSKFPYLVSLTSANDVFSKAQASGNDILFTAADGVTKIPHEIEQYNSGTPVLTAWVQIPAFTHGADVVIYMYYGNPSAANQQQPTQVWDAAYGAVWHLDETGSGSYYRDSTSNGNSGLGGTISSTNAPTRTASTAISGFGQTFNKAHPDSIKVSGKMGQPSSATVSAWVNLTSPDTFGSEVFSIGDSLALRLDDSGNQGISGFFYNGSTWPMLRAGPSYNMAGQGWHLVTYRIDTGTHRQYLYKDGVVIGSMATTGSPTYTAGPDTYIGIHGNGQTGLAYNGSMDEVRFSNVSRSDDWILTEYQTQATSAQGAPATGIVDSTKFIKLRSSQLQYFQYKQTVTINGSKVVGTQTNFPVLVHLTLPTAHVLNANGYDTLFTDSSGVPLSEEIVSYNAGDFWAWVNIPLLVSGADTTLYLYYGNATITTPPAASAVWDSNYLMVQHLNTNPASTLLDSTSNAANGTNANMTVANQVAGQIKYGVSFNGSNQSISVPYAKVNVTTGLTVSAWVNLSNTTTDQKIFSDMNPPNLGYNLGIASGGLDPEVRDSAGILTRFGTPQGSISNNTWTHVAFTWTTSGQMVGYINGAQVASMAATANNVGAQTTYTAKMGTDAWSSTFSAAGILDEVRVSNVSRSANWLATEYNNQSNATPGAGNFIKSVGAETAAYSSWWSSSWNYKKTLTLNADKVGANNAPKDNSDLVNMPVLLSWTDTDLVTGAQFAAADLAFVINGQKLNHEIVSFDQFTGAIVAWLQIPAISSSTDTLVDMYYGNPSAPDQENVTGTWSNGYAGVWHMEESGGGTNTIYRDSSPAANNGSSGTVTITGAPTAVAGEITGGQQFNGTSNTITTTVSATNLQLFTISAWIKTNSLSGAKVMGFESAQTGTGSPSFDRHIYVGTDGKVYFGAFSGAQDIAVSTLAYNDNAWHYLVGVRDATNNIRLFVDGALVGSHANASAQNYTGWWRLGSSRLAGWTNGVDRAYFPGLMDEARVSYGPRNADWTKAEFVNQSAPGSNVTFAAPPAVSTWSSVDGNNWGGLATYWNPSGVPDSISAQVVIGGTGGPKLDQNRTVQQLTIQTAASSLDLNGHGLTINGTNGFSNKGTIYFSGGTDSISYMDTTAGTVVYKTTNASIRSFGSTDYFNLTVDTITANLTSNITVAGNLSLANNATLNLNGYTLTVQGDVTGTGTIAVGSGTLVAQGNITASTVTATSGLIQVARTFGPTSFTAGTGTVQFISPAWNGQVTGSRSFNNLSIVTPGKTVLFQNGTTQTVANLTVTGSIAGQVSLLSTTDASTWTIAPTVSSVSYAYVKDSNASSVVFANNSTDGTGNNANWKFNQAGQLHHFAISAVTIPSK